MNIQIKEFSGPLDLLLQLIRSEEMDIFEIDIHKITDQYLNFIKEHSIPDLNSAGDFIRMAALLIYIKSKSLFPSDSQMDSDSENEEELQKDLVKSLLKMQAVQDICRKFNQYPLLNRDVWNSGAAAGELSDLFSESRKIDVKQQPILKLMRAYHKMFQKKAAQPAVSMKEPLPFMEDCLRSIRSRLTVGSQVKMSALIRQKNKNTLAYTLVSFLALLELGRLGIVSLTQEHDDISISVKKDFKEIDFGFIRGVEGTAT